jgi:hypothetical protein
MCCIQPSNTHGSGVKGASQIFAPQRSSVTLILRGICGRKGSEKPAVRRGDEDLQRTARPEV